MFEVHEYATFYIVVDFLFVCIDIYIHIYTELGKPGTICLLRVADTLNSRKLHQSLWVAFCGGYPFVVASALQVFKVLTVEILDL